jgi:hypothetical protein
MITQFRILPTEGKRRSVAAVLALAIVAAAVLAVAASGPFAEAFAALNVDRQLDQVQAAVVTAHQASLTTAKLIPRAKQEVAAAEEALRLTQKNLQAGTGLTIDVLQAQDTADQARLRYATALFRYNQSQINLLAAIGLIDLETIEGRPALPRVPGHN